MRKTILLAASAVSAVAAACAAQAQTTCVSNASQPCDPVITRVSALEVTARNLEDTLPEQLAQTGVKVTVIPGQAIRNGNYTDAATALQMLAPGMFVLPENGPFTTGTATDMSILGSRTQDVLLLIDGVRINNRLFTTQVNLDTVPSGIVDHIELLSGGQSLFYGTQALAGAVNIVTKPFTDHLSGAARVSGDTTTNRHYDLNLSDGVKLGQFVVYASGDRSEGYQAFRDQDYQPSAGDRNHWYWMYTEGAKYQADLNSQLRLGASYQRTDGVIDLVRPFRIAADIDTRAEDLATLKLDYQANDRLGVFIKGYWHNWAATNTITLNNPLKPGTTIVGIDHAFYGYKDYGVNALGKYDLAKGVQAYFGYDLQKYGGRSDGIVIAPTEEEVNAAFGQLRLTPELIPNAALAAGFRYNNSSRGPSTTIWNVSGRYDWPAGVYLKGEAGTNFLLPSAEQLFANDVIEEERGNPDLKPEQSIGGEASLGARFQAMGHASRIEVTGFARDIRNAIDLTGFDPKTTQFLWGNRTDLVTTRGVQIEGETALTQGVRANLAYTYNETRDSTGAQINNIPLQLIKAGVDWSPQNLPVGVTANLAYTGKLTTPYLTRRLNYGEFATVDLSGRYFLDPARHHELNLSIRNLFDRQYGKFYRGCMDVLRDFPLGCSKPFAYQSLAPPRTVAFSYRYSF
jgi:vitamin B12 transporter